MLFATWSLTNFDISFQVLTYYNISEVPFLSGNTYEWTLTLSAVL